MVNNNIVNCLTSLLQLLTLMQLGGPSWDVKLGRRDAKTTSRAAANNGIPQPTFNLNRLISRFSALGLSTKDLVALSGMLLTPLFFWEKI